MALTLTAIIVTGAWLTISTTAIVNVFIMLRLSKADSADDPTPTVSILIPARNEADVIAATVDNLARQADSSTEILLLDDNSTDNTAAIAREAAVPYAATFRVIHGKLLPDGWGGKNWACHQLSEAATGDRLIFTDADVTWSAGSLQAALAMQHAHRADLLTVWPTQNTQTWAERLVVPLMAFVTLGYLPHWAVNHIPHASFAAANGQCMIFTRDAYAKIGGHKAVANAIVEDIRLAQQIKAGGMRLRMADGGGLIRCRMYQNWGDVRNGYAKNIIAGYGESIPALLAATVFHWLILLWPLYWLIASLLRGDGFSTAWAAALVAIGILTRALTAQATRQRAHDALWMPLSALLMTIIAGQAIYWYTRFGGPRWKGRTLVRKTT